MKGFTQVVGGLAWAVLSGAAMAVGQMLAANLLQGHIQNFASEIHGTRRVGFDPH